MTTIWSTNEREIWTPPRRLSVSQWADENFVLPPTDPKPGRWVTDFMPHQREVLDSFSDPLCEEIVVESGAQCGKSRMVEIFGAYTVCVFGVDMLHIVPRDADTRTLVRGRLRPLIEVCPALGAEVTDSAQDLTFDQLRFRRCSWYLGASNSAAAMASKSCGVVLIDEVGKFPGLIKLEGSPLGLIIQRTNAFEGRRKIIKVSTPTTDTHGIHPEFVKTDQRHYHVPCHVCGHWQPLEFSQVKWPKGADADAIARDKLAWYECRACDARWTDADKRRQTRVGKYVQHFASIDDRGVIRGARPASARGFAWSGLLSNLRTFSDFAARFLRAKESDDLAGFFRSDIGTPWQKRIETVSTESLQTNVLEGHVLGFVPPEATVLCAGADVGKNACHWAVWAFAPGMESWLVDRGIVSSVEQLADVIGASFEGFDSPVRRLLLDIGWEEGTKVTKVSQHPIYDFAARHRSQVWLSLGRRTLASGKPYEMSTMDRSPAGKALPGGVQRAVINTTFFKDLFSERRSLGDGEPGRMHLPEDIDETFLDQLASEHKVESEDGTEAWVKRPGGGQNHFLDASLLAFVAAWTLRVWKSPKSRAAPSDPRHAAPATPPKPTPRRDEKPRPRPTRETRKPSPSLGGLAGARGRRFGRR